MKMMSPIFLNLIIILLTICLSSSDAQPTNKPLFISCGLPKSATSQSSDSRTWMSDEDSTYAPVDINSISSVATVIGQDPPYDTARLFQFPLTYTFSLPPGPKFLRLYFTCSTSYNTIQPSQFFISLQANEFNLLKNFSPFLNTPDDKSQIIKYEFHLTVENHLNLTFTPGDGANDNNSSGFINAIEIVPIPDGLYINLTKHLDYISNPEAGYIPQNPTALQTAYRLNVGGATIPPNEDSGSMWRTWYYDLNYMPKRFTGKEGGIKYGTPPKLNYTVIPAYVAPALVYASVRIIGDNPVEVRLRNNLTWIFQVDPGFDYLMRLHLCEMNVNITPSVNRAFDVYIDNQMAISGVDVWAISGGLGVPIYLQTVIRVYGDSNGTKVPLRLDLHPRNTGEGDVLLNGLEILKFSEFTGRYSYLAGPNPPQGPQVPTSPTTFHGKGSRHHLLPPIIGGAIFVSLFVLGCVVYKRRANQKDMFKMKTMDTNTSSKEKWAPISVGSTASTLSSSLPCDLCRRFSFTQIRVATSNFDESLVVGRGGFGKVYKGSIDGGTTIVAIKRLNSTSKQGAREFQTEIEMLSRLRHVHLVSLIGYCEDEGEMILVYEYMPQGTLRDHLMYKIPEKLGNNTPLSWKQRLTICVGSARGLHYLHAGAKQLIIHRDVKSTNILLDDKWTAKVSDFGLSKVGPEQGGVGSLHVSTAVKGSAGYLDPEYYRSHQLTEKSDVYSFGVVLFEVLCARAAVNPNLPREEANLAMWARSRYKKEILHTIVDPTLTGQIAPESLRKFGEIANMCVRDQGSDRPSMGDVVWGLEFALQLQETAQQNIIRSGSIDESFDLSSTTFNGLLDVGIANSMEDFTASRDNFTESSVVQSDSKRLLDSRSTTSISSDYPVDIKSASVFSEIIDPKAR
ncbi:probable receptor-like protein kinase At5g38990 [Spinacia oleracea]|uniref:Probable receptor-like protein kinase At5g38990 n=1 Tax=Spinacia oleracea TaxID=3562 RepID=A0A9R0HY85_SPIOL|nr:probable receptor-like protein kinase At5g38990 [Spinacia oleracea]